MKANPCKLTHRQLTCKLHLPDGLVPELTRPGVAPFYYTRGNLYSSDCTKSCLSHFRALMSRLTLRVRKYVISNNSEKGHYSDHPKESLWKKGPMLVA